MVMGYRLLSGATDQMAPPKLVQVTSGQSESPSGQPIVAAGQNHSLPARISIPRIKVDALVQYMGLTKANSMDVPKNIDDTGWYKYGTLPGNIGSAVIAGHIDGPKGQPAVFAELNKLQTGDHVSITDTNGAVVQFTVRTSKTYGPNEQPDEVFHSTDGAHLNLITCSGEWDSKQHQFLERLVVFADKI
jgi:LPXTG-site transpeptidase (sortase) family protein